MIPKNVQMPNPNPKYKPPGTPGGGRGGNKMKCSGKNCPMQRPYDVKACVFLEHCPYATLIPCTNADRIRAMSDEELASEMNQRSILTICDIVCQGDCKAIATLNKTRGEVCEEIIMEWLSQQRRNLDG